MRNTHIPNGGRPKSNSSDGAGGILSFTQVFYVWILARTHRGTLTLGVGRQSGPGRPPYSRGLGYTNTTTCY